jgi:Kef-type K+ transport system membrane component KefB
MSLLRSIWQDTLWLNSCLHPALRIVLLILGIALIVAAWYVGAEWWLAPVNLRYTTRSSSRIEVVSVIFAIILIVYISYVTDRDHRKSR